MCVTYDSYVCAYLYTCKEGRILAVELRDSWEVYDL